MATAERRPSLHEVLGSLVRLAWRWTAATETAVALIVILAFVLALATVFERVWGPAAVRHYIYHSWWFILLFGLLGINILAAVLVRFPWRLHQSGFVMTHVGLLALMIGMAQSLVGGIEGRVTLAEGVRRDSIWLTHQCELRMTRLTGNVPRRAIVFRFDAPVDLTNDILESGLANENLEVRVLEIRPATSVDPSDSIGPFDPSVPLSESASLVEIRSGGSAQQVWLRRNGIGRTMSTEGGPILLELASQRRKLSFSMELLQFQRIRNPGGFGDASFASRIRLADDRSHVVRVADITMNEPMTHEGFRFYQIDLHQLPDGKSMVTLGVASDPGRLLKYLGVAAVCLGTVLTFLTRERSPNRSAASDFLPPLSPGPRRATGER